ncbi:hypothetical protein [Thiolapillus sp.]|uniref:hypothetical protein n=1 Tax=Thiolapillus sp. TaxID=2017437 RepID=UPI0025F70E12|nr:hypothetical protein [Thiolapillus sp.]
MSSVHCIRREGENTKQSLLPAGVHAIKRVFGLVIDFGTSQSPKSTRPLTT